MAITYVVEGAKIKCSQGVGESVLKCTNDNNVKLHDQTVLTVADNVPNINFTPFSSCKSKLNSTVDEVNESPVVCNPSICMKWMNAKEDVILNGEFVLNSNCTLTCMYNGRIEIVDDGQRKG